MGSLIIFWILCGITSAVVAANKGRGGCSWFAMGVVLGPFGLILALVVPRDQVAVEMEAIDSGRMKKCPHCAEIVRSEAKICRYCQQELVTSSQLEGVEGADSDRLMSSDDPVIGSCARCGVELTRRSTHYREGSHWCHNHFPTR